MDLETRMVALELRWREADDLARAARAELAAQLPSVISTDLIRRQIATAEERKQRILRKIVLLEEQMDLRI